MTGRNAKNVENQINPKREKERQKRIESELCIKVTLNAVCPLRGTTISPLGIS